MEGVEDLKQLRLELDQAHKVLSDQTEELEKTLKRLAEVEGQREAQRNILIRFEEESGRERSLDEAESRRLMSVFQEEHKKRLDIEKQIKDILGVEAEATVPVPEATTDTDGESEHDEESENEEEPEHEEGPEHENLSEESLVEEEKENPICVQPDPRKSPLPVVPSGNLLASANPVMSINGGFQSLSHVTANQPGPSAHLAPSISNETSQESTTQAASEGEYKFSCEVCKGSFPSFTNLKRHLWTVHDMEEKRFSIGCTDCGKMFSDRKDHLLHRKQAHCTKRRPDTSRARPSSAKKHGFTSKLGPGYFCLCGLCFMDQNYLEKHLDQHRPVSQLETAHSTTFLTKSGNSFTITAIPCQSNESITLRCSQCPETFSAYEELNKHFRKNHIS